MNIAWRLALAPFVGRQRTYAKLLEHLAAVRGDRANHAAVLRILLKKWNLNWENGSRRSRIADYEYLDRLLREWALDRTREPPDASAARATALVAELLVIQRETGNFRIDGRMMKLRAAVRYASMLKELRSCLTSLSLASP